MRPKQWSFALILALVVAAVTLLIVPGAWARPKFKVLAGVPGGLWSGLTFDAKGNLYGVTSGGGTNGVGSVFELSRDSKGKWSVTTLHSFDGKDGSSPNGGLIFDSVGNLYGTASGGGAHDHGTAFELQPGSNGWTFTDFYDFCREYPYNCDDGQNPVAGFVMDGAGNLYDSAGGGTCHGYGVAFEFTPGSGGWNENILFDWGCRNYDATSSSGPLIFDKVGNLYGTSGGGGLYHGGTVFKLTYSSGGWKELLLYQFCPGGFPCTDGAGPTSGVIFHGSGDLYGTTPGGGVNKCGEGNCGTVFKLKRSRKGQWKENVLYSFRGGKAGNTPSGPVVFDKKGSMYGTAAQGGSPKCSGGCGVVYKLAPQANGAWKYTVLHSFTGTDGGFPIGGVVLDKVGNLYGTAYDVVFEITP